MCISGRGFIGIPSCALSHRAVAVLRTVHHPSVSQPAEEWTGCASFGMPTGRRTHDCCNLTICNRTVLNPNKSHRQQTWNLETPHTLNTHTQSLLCRTAPQLVTFLPRTEPPNERLGTAPNPNPVVALVCLCACVCSPAPAQIETAPPLASFFQQRCTCAIYLAMYVPTQAGCTVHNQGQSINLQPSRGGRLQRRCRPVKLECDLS